jgi:hypothetical protein
MTISSRSSRDVVQNVLWVDDALILKEPSVDSWSPSQQLSSLVQPRTDITTWITNPFVVSEADK